MRIVLHRVQYRHEWVKRVPCQHPPATVLLHTLIPAKMPDYLRILFLIRRIILKVCEREMFNRITTLDFPAKLSQNLISFPNSSNKYLDAQVQHLGGMSFYFLLLLFFCCIDVLHLLSQPASPCLDAELCLVEVTFNSCTIQLVVLQQY